MELQAVGDIREMSFQNVVDQILKPNNVNLGGFPEEIFQKLTDEEKEKLICNVCFMIVNDPRECQNKHLFCQTCIFAWTMTYGENSQKCPMCRADQTDYKECPEVTKTLENKMVLCPEDKCTFKAPLKVFLMHGHGKSRFGNAHVDFDKLRPQRPDGARLLVLPTLNVTGGTRRERAESIRSQLQQGRMMIQQMMVLLHLEMQLRQQAVTSFQQATDPTTRLHRLDEVMALNEQLNEVGSTLSTMLNSPINSIIAANRIIGESSVSRTSDRRPFDWETPLASSGRQAAAEDNDSDSSESSEGSAIMSLAHNLVGDRIIRNIGNDTQRDRSYRRSDIGESLLRSTSDRNSTSTGDIPVINEGRHLSDYSQANIATASSVATDIHPRVLLGRDQMPRRSLGLRQSDDMGTSTSSQTNTAAGHSGSGSNTTQRLTSASTQRVGLSTTINSRNQTLPDVSSSNTSGREPPASNNSSLPNSVARQQRSIPSESTNLNINTSNPPIIRRQQHTPRPPSASSSSILQRGISPRPPSTQPEEANEPDVNRTRAAVPRGSTAYREVQQMLNNQRPERSVSRSDTTGNNSGGSTISRQTESNTLGGSRNTNTRTSVTQSSTSTLGTRTSTNQTTPNAGTNHTNPSNTTTPRYQERNRPSNLTADSTNLSNTPTRPRINNVSRATRENDSSSNSFGSLDRSLVEQSNDTSGTSNRGVVTRRRANSLQRSTERRPTLTDQSAPRNSNAGQSNSRSTGLRQQSRTQTNTSTSVAQRKPGTSESQSTTPRKTTTGAVPKIRGSLNPGIGTAGNTSRTVTTNGRTVYRARRRSEIKEDMRRQRNEDG